MKNQYLLLEDVDGSGLKGDIVSAKPGFFRNYLHPQKKAIRAEKHLIRLQEKLKEERSKQAAVDKKDSEKLASELVGKILKATVKVDAEGHPYGSVAAKDVVTMLKEQFDVTLDKRNVVMPRPIKKIGQFEVELKLKEGVPAKVGIEIIAEEAQG